MSRQHYVLNDNFQLKIRQGTLVLPILQLEQWIFGSLCGSNLVEATFDGKTIAVS